MLDLTAPRWYRIDALLDDALAQAPGERTAWLRAACGDDIALYREVCDVLALAEDAERIVGDSVVAFAEPLLHDADASEGLRAGDRIGPYEIESESGRGGMGVVYRARRADGAFEKAVALKVVKRGMDTDAVLRRFHRERHILASLDHPGIARLLDAGATPDGRPYLVMEFVAGEPITAYCDERSLSRSVCLDLFERVCEAVQYAHRRLVVHRDLKPSNLLVAETDAGPPGVKLLDFGIARLLGVSPEDDVTQPGVRPLTPAYAAPEQRAGSDVTTATDVYALGVVLHEVLTGERWGHASRPPGADRPRFGGDLGRIVEKALREDLDARYASVEALLGDLRRYRAGLPIRARPASLRYRMSKFVGRHRTAVAVASLVGLLAVFVGVLYARGIEREARVVGAEAERARLMAGVMRDLFETADPYTLGGQRGDSLLLARGQEVVKTELAAEPELQVDLLTTLGRVYRERGQYASARALLTQALGIAESTHPDAHPSVIRTLRQLGGLYSDLGAYGSARSTYRRMAHAEQSLYGEAAPPVFVTLSLLAQIEALDGRADAAERQHREIVALSRRLHAPTDSAHILAVWKLARALYMRGKYAEAEASLQEVLALRRQAYGNVHPAVAHALQWVGLVQTDLGAFDASGASLRGALAMQRHLLGPDHNDVAVSLFGLGLLANERGDPAVAARWVRESVTMSERVLGETHTSTAFRTLVLSDVLRQAGAFDEAVEAADRAEAIYRRSLGATSPGVSRAFASRARILSDARRDAAPAFQRAFASFGADSTSRPFHEAQVSYGEWLVQAGRAAEAEPILRRSLSALEASTAARHDRAVLQAKAALGRAQVALGRSAEARSLLADVAEITTDHYGAGHPSARAARRALLP